MLIHWQIIFFIYIYLLINFILLKNDKYSWINIFKKIIKQDQLTNSSPESQKIIEELKGGGISSSLNLGFNKNTENEEGKKNGENTLINLNNNIINNNCYHLI